MDIAQMRMMLVLADCKSMTTTAKKLHVTQPALTYQLKVIESELGFKVFNRTRTGTSLTAEGAFFHETIKGIVAEYDETVRLTRAMAKGVAAGTIRVGTNSYSRDAISFLLSMSQPLTRFSLIPIGSSDPVRLLREGVIDFWSTSDAGLEHTPPTIKFAELSRAGLSAFVPKGHPLSRRVALTVQDLAHATVWLWPQGAASKAADTLRMQLEGLGADIADLIPGLPAIMTAFMDDGVVVYDDGFLPPSASSAAQVPIQDAPRDSLGLAYLASQEERLAPVIANLKDHMPLNQGRTVSQSELAAERIVSVLDEISATVRRGGMKDIVPLVDYGLELGVSAHHLLNRGLLAGLNAMGGAFAQGDACMTEMMAAVSTANLAMDVLQPHIAVEDEKLLAGCAAIGTVVGDIHDVGKNLVRIMLESRDIQVTDLGTEVPAEAFVEHVRNNSDCNLVLISVNRTESIGEARAVIAALEAAKLRDQLFVMVGGSAIDAAIAEEIGADVYTQSAENAADTARAFLSI